MHEQQKTSLDFESVVGCFHCSAA